MSPADQAPLLDPPAPFQALEIDDPDLMEELSVADGWQAPRYTQLTASPFRALYGTRLLSSGAVHTEQFSPRIHVSAAPPKGMTTVGLRFRDAGPCRLGGREVGLDQVVIVTDRRDVEFNSLDGTRMLYFDFSGRRLEQLAALFGEKGRPAMGGGVLTVGQATVDRLRRQGLALLESDSFRGLAEGESHLLAKLATLRQGEVARPLAPRRRSRIVSVARDFIESRLAEPLRVEDLCAVTGATYRTLHRSFQEILGVSPIAYIKARRLRRTRAALLAADRYRATVTRVAHDHGFAHLGRFSRDYRRMFGETPSLTLASR